MALRRNSIYMPFDVEGVYLTSAEQPQGSTNCEV